MYFFSTFIFTCLLTSCSSLRLIGKPAFRVRLHRCHRRAHHLRHHRTRGSLWQHPRRHRHHRQQADEVHHQLPYLQVSSFINSLREIFTLLLPHLSIPLYSSDHKLLLFLSYSLFHVVSGNRAKTWYTKHLISLPFAICIHLLVSSFLSSGAFPFLYWATVHNFVGFYSFSCKCFCISLSLPPGIVTPFFLSSFL